MESKEQMAMNLNIIRNKEFKKLFICTTITWIIIMTILLISSRMPDADFHSVLKFYIIFAIIFYVLFILALYLVLNAHYNRIRRITLEVEQMSRGNFGKLAENLKVGDIDILEFQLYQMSKRVQVSLEQANQDKNIVKGTISGLSHQFKTPITVMRTFNDLLLEGAITDTTVAVEFITKSSAQLDKLERLVQMFLKLSKIESGITLINKSNNDINDTIHKIILSLREKAYKKEQSITFENSENNMIAFYDKEWLFEAIYNIVDNAIEYTPSKGYIKIYVSKAETHLRIEIEDNGIGIGENDIPHVFDIFYQGASAKKQNTNSSGIGLALTKLIVDKHAGILKIDSCIGVGTKVTLILPHSEP